MKSENHHMVTDVGTTWTDRISESLLCQFQCVPLLERVNYWKPEEAEQETTRKRRKTEIWPTHQMPKNKSAALRVSLAGDGDGLLAPRSRNY